jgi:hypothetical protein
MLSALQLKVETVGAPITSAATGASDATGGAAGAKSGKGGVAAATAADALPASLEPFSSLLQDISLTPLLRLTSLLEALQVIVMIIKCMIYIEGG